MLEEAIQRLKAGEVIAFPTETLYGLGADPRNPQAVEKLLDLKSRHSGEGISLIASESFQPASKLGKLLAEKYWPGALTMVLELEEKFPPGIAANDGSVAVRVSSSLLSRKLAEATGGFITATSANPHGESPAESAQQAKAYFPDLFVLDSGELPQARQASTIVDVRNNEVRVLRQGSVII